MKKTVGIFIPVYNGEKYIGDTIKSILQQTFTDLVIHCVDDTSTDSSFEILQNMTLVDDRIKIYQKVNGGNTAKSWNFILPIIKEDYIFYMSQDDLISSNALEEMIIKANETDADCILPDMVWYYENNNNNNNDKIIGVNGNRNIILSGEQALVHSLFWTIHGFALRKRELYYNEFFPEDCFDSDEYMTRKLFSKSKTVAFSNGLFNFRQDNPDAITKDFTYKNYFSLITYYRVFNLLRGTQDLTEIRKRWIYHIVYKHEILFKNFTNNVGINSLEEKRNVDKLFCKYRKKLFFISLSADIKPTSIFDRLLLIKYIYFTHR